MERIYLDNAATSWPKPESVYAAVDHTQRVLGAPAGRGGYRQVVDALKLVEQTRGLVAKFINAPKRQNIAFTFNGTDSLSTVIFGLLQPGDHVVTSVVEHNSVLRPLKHLESNGIEVTYVGCDVFGRFGEEEVISAIRPSTRLVSLIHVSNVTGAIQPVANIKSGIRESGNEKAVFLLDAAQSLGHFPVDVQALGCDVLTAPGHKGLLGPFGTGILYCHDDIADQIRPLRFGGTGTDGSLEVQPTKTPDKFESGNLNVPGIAGVNAGIKFLTSDEGIEAHEVSKTNSELMLDGLLTINGVSVQGPPDLASRIGVFSISIDDFDCHDAASILDSNWIIQTRSGLHCAPLIHRALGTEKRHGTIRLSLGPFTTDVQVKKTLSALAELVNSVGSL